MCWSGEIRLFRVLNNTHSYLHHVAGALPFIIPSLRFFCLKGIDQENSILRHQLSPWAPPILLLELFLIAQCQVWIGYHPHLSGWEGWLLRLWILPVSEENIARLVLGWLSVVRSFGSWKQTVVSEKLSGKKQCFCGCMCYKVGLYNTCYETECRGIICEALLLRNGIPCVHNYISILTISVPELFFMNAFLY